MICSWVAQLLSGVRDAVRAEDAESFLQLRHGHRSAKARHGDARLRVHGALDEVCDVLDVASLQADLLLSKRPSMMLLEKSECSSSRRKSLK